MQAHAKKHTQYTVLYSHTVLWAVNHAPIHHLLILPQLLHSVFLLPLLSVLPVVCRLLASLPILTFTRPPPPWLGSCLPVRLCHLPVWHPCMTFCLLSLILHSLFTSHSLISPFFLTFLSWSRSLFIVFSFNLSSSSYIIQASASHYIKNNLKACSCVPPNRQVFVHRL